MKYSCFSNLLTENVEWEWAGTNSSTWTAAEGSLTSQKTEGVVCFQCAGIRRSNFAESLGICGFYRFSLLVFNESFSFENAHWVCVVGHPGAPSVRFKALEFPKQCIFGERKRTRGEKKKTYWISEKNMETRRGLEWLKPSLRIRNNTELVWMWCFDFKVSLFFFLNGVFFFSIPHKQSFFLLDFWMTPPKSPCLTPKHRKVLENVGKRPDLKSLETELSWSIRHSGCFELSDYCTIIIQLQGNKTNQITFPLSEGEKVPCCSARNQAEAFINFIASVFPPKWKV